MYVEEQIEILRRVLKAALKDAQQSVDYKYVDVFQHLLDEIQRIQNYIERMNND